MYLLLEGNVCGVFYKLEYSVGTVQITHNNIGNKFGATDCKKGPYNILRST